MRATWAVLAMLVWGGEAMAKPPIDDGGGPGEITASKDFSGYVTLANASGAVFCEVWRDYYYDADTGAFIGWAGPPYIKSETCTSTGGGDGSGPDCPPGDIACMCAGSGNAGNPACEGGGPLTPDIQPPADCVEVGAAKQCKAGGTCTTCKAKKKAACDECITATKATNQKIEDDFRSCKQQADGYARSQCLQGRLPGGQRFGDWVKVDQCIAERRPSHPGMTDDQIYAAYCRPKKAIEATECTVEWSGNTECTTNPAFTDCSNLWTYGRDWTQTTFEGSASGSWSGGGATVNIGGKTSKTVVWGPETGSYEACEKKRDAQKELRTEAAAECKGAVNAKYQGGPTCK